MESESSLWGGGACPCKQHSSHFRCDWVIQCCKQINYTIYIIIYIIFIIIYIIYIIIMMSVRFRRGLLFLMQGLVCLSFHEHKSRHITSFLIC